MVNDLIKYEKERYEIDELFYRKYDYDKCIEKTKEFIKIIEDEGSCEYDFWYSYFNLSRCCNKLNRLNEAQEHILKAITFNAKESNYFDSLWMLAIIYRRQGKNDKALRFFNKSKEYYRKIGQMADVLLIENSVALMTNDLDLINNIIKDYKSINLDYKFNDYYINTLEGTRSQIISNLKSTINLA
jgi:tetratricopeptide (TPR) repeat protein